MKKSFSLYECFFELIDTLWNVNKTYNGWVRPLDAELIDTLWNVNDCR